MVPVIMQVQQHYNIIQVMTYCGIGRGGPIGRVQASRAEGRKFESRSRQTPLKLTPIIAYPGARITRIMARTD